MHKGRQAPIALIKQWKEGVGIGGGGGEGNILEGMLPHKMLTVNAIPVMAANTSQPEHMWSPDTVADPDLQLRRGPA